MAFQALEVISTERLWLIPITAPILRLMLLGHYEAAESSAGFTVLKGWDWLPKWVAKRRLQMMEEDPSQQSWLLRAVVHKTENRMIGYVGFHCKAGDPDLRKYCEYAVEMGYRISPAYQRKGYAREAAYALMQWAHEMHGVESFFLSISPDNTPSLAMARSIGFREVDTKIDEGDGLEIVLRMDVEEGCRTDKV